MYEGSPESEGVNRIQPQYLWLVDDALLPCTLVQGFLNRSKA